MPEGKNRRQLVLLLQGQLVTNMGNQVYDVAMLLWIKSLTGSAALMGLALLMTNLPQALLAPLGGKLSDRFGRVRTMVAADLVSALAVGVVVLSIWSGADPVWMITALCVGNLLLGAAAACFNPAVLALIPALVPRRQLERGNAAHQLSRMGGQVIGQGAGGLLVAALGAAGAFLLNSLSFLVSAGTEVWIKDPDRPAPASTARAAEGSLLGETRSTLRKVLREPALRALLFYIAAFHLCLSCLPVLLPFYTEHVLLLPDTWFGLFVAAYTMGIMGGFVVAGRLGPVTDRFRLIAAIGAVVGVLFGVAAATSSPLIAWVVFLGIGVGIGVVIVNLMTELQLRSPEGERGGVMGAASAIGDTSSPVGMALTGVALDVLVRQQISHAVSTRAILAASAALTVLVAGSALLGTPSRTAAGPSEGRPEPPSKRVV
jgi:MFS family permease